MCTVGLQRIRECLLESDAETRERDLSKVDYTDASGDGEGDDKPSCPYSPHQLIEDASHLLAVKMLRRGPEMPECLTVTGTGPCNASTLLTRPVAESHPDVDRANMPKPHFVGYVITSSKHLGYCYLSRAEEHHLLLSCI